jgi:hypothetical protein
MDNTISQDPVDASEIHFIIFKPFSEYYYSYSINDISNFHLIERDKLFIFTEKYLAKEVTRKAEKLCKRFFSFIYISETKDIEVLETEEITDSLNTIIRDKLIDKSLSKETPSLYNSLKTSTSSLYSKLNPKK